MVQMQIYGGGVAESEVRSLVELTALLQRERRGVVVLMVAAMNGREWWPAVVGKFAAGNGRSWWRLGFKEN
ncbi:hypothetical protein DEO72_LG1g2639 [Vigna unguiculata]|uniref:Uncharacterized protein n=1 Tax=Vigna unguiculata TaxID=3917 RepID=A0A4D6KN72_VIGUN|nr:hypothetical protein DEO72_LG1g2639 [Vigna unguiculata]